jgi:hypothetical protein
MARWSASADYYTELSAGGKATSCALQGPCYPVLTSQANVWHSCHTQKLENLPLSTDDVDDLVSCINCCDANNLTATTCNAAANYVRARCCDACAAAACVLTRASAAAWRRRRAA